MDRGEVKIYHLPTRMRLVQSIIAIIILILLGLIIFYDISYKAEFLSLCGTVYLAYFAWTLLYQVFFARLTISPEHIEYHRFGGYVRARWDEITRIGAQRGLFWGKYQGLFVKPSFEPPIWLVTFGSEKHVPVGMFIKDWRDSEMGREIKRYAAEIFD